MTKNTSNAEPSVNCLSQPHCQKNKYVYIGISMYFWKVTLNDLNIL